MGSGQWASQGISEFFHVVPITRIPLPLSSHINLDSRSFKEKVGTGDQKVQPTQTSERGRGANGADICPKQPKQHKELGEEPKFGILTPVAFKACPYPLQTMKPLCLYLSLPSLYFIPSDQLFSAFSYQAQSQIHQLLSSIIFCSLCLYFLSSPGLLVTVHNSWASAMRFFPCDSSQR